MRSMRALSPEGAASAAPASSSAAATAPELMNRARLTLGPCGRGNARARPVLRARPGVVPVARPRDQVIRGARPPAAGQVFEHWRGDGEERIDDLPGSLDLVLAREVRGVTDQGGADEDLVGVHVISL